jgi:hypothetical protein
VWSAKHAIARSAKGLRQQTRSHVQADRRSHNHFCGKNFEWIVLGLSARPTAERVTAEKATPLQKK